MPQFSKMLTLRGALVITVALATPLQLTAADLVSDAWQVASQVLGGTLTTCEEEIIRAILERRVAECGHATASSDPRRTARASFINWLGLDHDLSRRIGPRGIEIHGATVTGKIDLSHRRLSYPLTFYDSDITEEMELSSAEIPEISFTKTQMRGLVAEHLRVTGSFGLDHGSHSQGRIHLVDADIGGFLSFDGATLTNTGYPTVVADGLGVPPALGREPLRIDALAGQVLRDALGALL